MTLEAISTEPVIERLRNLKKYMPGEDDTLYRFGEYLADRLGGHPELLPQGFKMATELGLYDLQKGVNGFTGEPIQNSLVGYPPTIYALLGMRVADLADATCPEDFAKEVRDFDEQVMAKMREVNLEHLAHDEANFAHSTREPTSMDPLISGPRPFFYQWTQDEGMEILTFEDPTKPDTAKLFRYDKKQIYGGVDLENDTPAVVGNDVVQVLREYSSR